MGKPGRWGLKRGKVDGGESGAISYPPSQLTEITVSESSPTRRNVSLRLGGPRWPKQSGPSIPPAGRRLKPGLKRGRVDGRRLKPGRWGVKRGRVDWGESGPISVAPPPPKLHPAILQHTRAQTQV